jgi:hypothetical protein
VIGGRLMRAARARLDRLAGRLRTARDDSGFALILVMVVSTVIMAAAAATVTVITPNILAAKQNQDNQAAFAAAMAGVDDVVAYLTSIADCRSTTKICTQALGANSTAANRPQLAGTNQTFRWTTDATATQDNYVRVHSTGTVLKTSKALVADIALAPSILSFGYYTDFESQSPNFLYDYFPGRTIALTNSTTYGKVNATDTRGRTITVTSPSSVHWSGPATSGTSPNPASMCGQHWYRDSAASPGRSSYSPPSVWGESGTVGSSASLVRSASCDVVFTTGMTFDGPIYTRDAMLISDATVGGVGPIFKQPVLTLWGFAGKNSPPVPVTPWRRDDGPGGAGGAISAQSPHAPATATLDLQLPTDIGTTGLPTDVCIYRGPTRVRLNGDGTATITSPQTHAPDPASDPSCYPPGPLLGGIVNFTLDYRHHGHGGIYVKDLTDATHPKPAAGWPGTGTRSTIPAAAANSVFYLAAPVGTATPDQTDSTSAVSASCSSTVKYAGTASWPCAWTNVATTTDVGTGAGWSAYTTTTKCNANPAATDRELFECEYSHTAGATTPSPTNNYATLRTAMQTQFATAGCLTGSTTAQATCLSAAVNAALRTANTAQHAYDYATPASGDHRYLVTSAVAASSTPGTPQSVGSAPTPPMSSDALFSSASAPAQEAATKTPITLKVSRQAYGCVNSSGSIIGSLITLITGLLGCLSGTPGWGNSTAQFTFTATQSNWAITTQPSGASYFPNTNDVTQYNRGTGGATGADGPGDLYIEGTNKGQLSLIAQNDIVVTGDVRDTSTDPTQDALDIVAGQNVRNYHPVKCVDQTSADVNSTDAGFCPNDITGLYRGVLETNGVLSSSHPAMQYVNINPTGPRRIDAAIFALSGSFLTDNYNRGNAIGGLTVNGGLYQANRGANGVQWEYLQSDTSRATSGFSLQYHYVDLQHSGLPYAPPATGGSNSRVWNVVSVSS